MQGGVPFTYTLSVVNNGPALAEQVVVQDAIPQGFFLTGLESISQGAFSNPISNVAIGNFGLIPAGGSAQLVIRMTSQVVTLDPGVLTISNPPSIARDYSVEALAFSEAPTSPGVSGQLKLVTDSVGDTNDGCTALSNTAALLNSIAVIRHSGLCPLDVAVSRAQGAGALAAVILKTTFDLNEIPGSGLDISIPALAMHSRDVDVLLPALAGTVNGTVAALQGQMLNVAYVSSAIPDPTSNNNFALQYTSFLNDTDFDSVPDVTDNCDNVDNVDQLDADNDGAGDLCDTCTDTDGDGFGNPEFVINTCASDGCISDSGKVFPGICGCGVSDANSDGDSQPDCFDGCPLNGSRIAPGVCGCSGLDVDANGNGILDCLKTPELRATLTNAQNLIKKLNANISGTSKKSIAQRRLRKDLGKLGADLGVFVAAGGIQLLNGALNPNDLASQTNTAIRKALKAKGKALAKNKKVALAAVLQFLSSLPA